ncbi:MAG: prenyltransferase/squalene oxidase repeat-containing protein [Candidatus Bathyarchaeia archaeon]
MNPTQTLLSSGNEAIAYFAKRDLLGESVNLIDQVWRLPEVQKLFRKQQPDGSWKHSGKEMVSYPKHHYSLVQTWKVFRILVEQYELNRGHEGARKAAEFLFSCQTPQGDIRGMLANQYATYYTGAMLAVLIKTGYEDDPRVDKGLEWLLSTRQNDGGWTVPILTHKFDRKTMYDLTSKYAEPVEPDKSKPFSHNATDMVLRAFAAHPRYRRRKEALKAADLLKSRFFQPDAYSSYHDASYWVRFAFWWPNIVTALDSLSSMGYPREDPDIQKALNWLVENQLPDGLWKLDYTEGKEDPCAKNEATKERRLWLTLRIAQILKRFSR